MADEHIVRIRTLAAAFLLWGVGGAATGQSPVHYVSPSGGHVPPFASWVNAATSIQAGVDAASDGDTVLVGDGVYDTGASAWAQWGNRVAISGPITVQSVNGPRRAIIRGDKQGAVRGAFLQSGAELIGFTVTGGGGGLDPLGWIAHVRGGGVFCTPDCVVQDCIIADNSAGVGGGAYGGTLVNCLILRNDAFLGGGECDATALNCTIVGNSAWQFGGGVLGGELRNSIVQFNGAWSEANHRYAQMSYCCTWPEAPGHGNITADPLFVDAAGGDFQLQAESPCINAGLNKPWMIGATDLDGNRRIVGGRVDMGAYESAVRSRPSLNCAGVR